MSADDKLTAFYDRIWQDDVAPLLRERLGGQRRHTARIGGAAAKAAGTLLDRAFKLRGRPFTRSLTVLGLKFGALLPDVWDWRVYHEKLNPKVRRFFEKKAQQQAEQLPEADALALFELSAHSSRDELKATWRRLSKRWHPDHAPNPAEVDAYRLRFITYRAAYERLEQAYAAGRLPRD